ncbi:hypothetical protein [Pantoea agglomerans]|uniref:hypothetical protein n=1 Tax=Enterobacter agglomerans TaxID=549 RepID=UPI003D9FF165
MIDFDKMIQNEEMADVILFLVSRSEKGIAYPSIDRFFGMHNAAEKYKSYNIELIHQLKKLEDTQQVSSTNVYGSGCQKGPDWKEPAFVTEKKYGIE